MIFNDAELQPPPPYSAEAEQSVLGALLVDNGAWPRVADRLQPGDFFDAEHAEIFGAIAALLAAGAPADAVTVRAHLEVAGKADITPPGFVQALADTVPSAHHLEAYAGLVREHAHRRRLLALADEIRRAALEPQGRSAAQIAEGVHATAGRMLQMAGAAPAPTARALQYIVGNEIDTDNRAFDDELVEGVIGKIAMAVLYGDSNTGKTFLALDIAGSVASGADWMGQRTRQGLVLYIATEAAESVKLRAAAYRRETGADLANLVIVTSPVNWFDGMVDVDAVIALSHRLELERGQRVALIVLDTLARVAAGANENAGQDMGRVMSNAEMVRNAAGCAMLWIHHCGKDAARGMRGWSGMRAAIDTEIEVTADEVSGVRTAEITKQRDLGGKGQRYGFTLKVIYMGRNHWGDPRTTCVIVPAEAPARAARKRRSEVAGAIEEFLIQHGSGCIKGALVKHFEGRFHRAAVYKEINKMIEDGMLISTGAVVALPGPPGPK